MSKKIKRKFCKREDFHVGDMIEYYDYEDETLRGRILEMYPDYAIIEINIPGKKSAKLELEKLEVSYREIVPMTMLYSGIRPKDPLEDSESLEVFNEEE